MSGAVPCSFAGSDLEPAGESGWGNDGTLLQDRKGKLLIIVMDFNDLFCSLCSESLLSLCFALPPHVQRERTWLVVVVDSEGMADHEKKIIAKKIDGFIKGNSLHIPVSLDFTCLFEPMLRSGSQIILMDSENQTLLFSPLPVKGDFLTQILRSLLT